MICKVTRYRMICDRCGNWLATSRSGGIAGDFVSKKEIQQAATQVYGWLTRFRNTGRPHDEDLCENCWTNEAANCGKEQEQKHESNGAIVKVPF